MFSLLSEISFVLSALGDYLRKVKPGTSLKKKLPCFRQDRFRLTEARKHGSFFGWVPEALFGLVVIQNYHHNTVNLRIPPQASKKLRGFRASVVPCFRQARFRLTEARKHGSLLVLSHNEPKKSFWDPASKSFRASVLPCFRASVLPCFRQARFRLTEARKPGSTEARKPGSFF